MKKLKSIKWVGAGRYMSNSNKYQHIPSWTCISLLGETYIYIYIYIYTYIHTCIHAHTYIYTHALKNLWWILSTKLGAVTQINPRFGINNLCNLHGHPLHIHCLTSFLKRLIVFLCLSSSSKIVHNWGAR